MAMEIGMWSAIRDYGMICGREQVEHICVVQWLRSICGGGCAYEITTHGMATRGREHGVSHRNARLLSSAIGMTRPPRSVRECGMGCWVRKWILGAVAGGAPRSRGIRRRRRIQTLSNLRRSVLAARVEAR